MRDADAVRPSPDAAAPGEVDVLIADPMRQR
jgi:hypothetical protein